MRFCKLARKRKHERRCIYLLPVCDLHDHGRPVHSDQPQSGALCAVVDPCVPVLCGLFVLLGAEFVAMLLIIVYVGAVAVLFLFVVMMLDIDFAELKAEMAKYMPLALLIGLVLLMQFAMAFGVWEASDQAAGLRGAVTPTDAHNTEALGLLLYDKYFLIFQLSGMILLVAMIGAIVLTLRHRTDVKRQDVMAQMHRDPAKAMELKDVKPGQGL